jgi:hypothetical protein
MSSVTSSTTTVTVPTSNVTVTATYKDAYYKLTVTGGSGGRSYTNGSRVTIRAILPPGKAFSRWAGETQFMASATSSTTTVTMPAANISVSVTYKTAYYPLTVNGGTGDGSYTNGQRVKIAATVPQGMKFADWNDGSTNASRIVTMPPAPVTYTANFVDIQKPTVAITAPTVSLRIFRTNGLFTVRGTAADNGTVSVVKVRLNSGSWTDASGTNVWSSPVMLTPGTNTIRAFSVDTAGNNSLTSSVSCVYVVTASLTIQTNGPGTVTRTPSGELEIGKTCMLTATPKAGGAFSSWTGDVMGTGRVVTVTMTSNKTVTANFTDSLKPTVAITAPTADQRILGTNGSFTVRGTAKDNGTMVGVHCRVNSGVWTNAVTTNGWKNWSILVALTNGSNLIQAFSEDTAGNYSSTSTVKCVYTEAGSLTITTNGPGKVTVAPTGPLLLNKTYTLTAAADAGAVFSNWTGDVIGSPTSKVVKVMLDISNKTKTVAANFIDTSKPTVVITYPANNAKVMTNGTVIIRGTAADNGVLNEVKYQLRTGDWTNAVSTNVFKAWTAPYVPAAGLNTSKVYSVDAQGNYSSTSTVVFTYIPGAVLTVQTNLPAGGTIIPSLNGKVLQIGSTNTMTAIAKSGYVFTNWTCGGSVVTNGKTIKFVMQTNLVLTANFRNLTAGDAVVDILAAPQTIVVDGSSKDWTDIPRSAFSYSSVTQEVAVALGGNNIALLMTGCPFGTSDTVLVYFKLRLTYGEGDNRHTVDLWTSGLVLCAMVDGQVITSLEAVLLNGVLEVKIPVEQAPSQVTIEEVACGMDIGNGTMTELFKFIP